MPENSGEILRKLAKIEKDLYFGNGKAGLTTRMEMAEKSIENIGKNMERISKNTTAVLIMLGSAILSAVGYVIVHALVR